MASHSPTSDISLSPPASTAAEIRGIAPPPGERVPGEIGQWVFIGGDMVMFALFFVAFAVERTQSRPAFHAGQQELSLALGTLNTLLLLTSSLLVALSVGALRSGAVARGRTLLLLAIACGAGFVVDKVLEYRHLLDSVDLTAAGSFFGYYFALTGMHLVHLVLGLGALSALFVWTGRPGARAARSPMLEGAGLYWHLVDLLWLILFPLLYVAS